jgi:FtsH-binding integral membrane protein
MFATLIFFAFRARFTPAVHKRIILIATIGLSIAAIARWPIALIHRNPVRTAFVSYIFLVILVTYDLWSTRKVYRATIWASALLIFGQQIRGPVGHTAAWHSFASWVQSLPQ